MWAGSRTNFASRDIFVSFIFCCVFFKRGEHCLCTVDAHSAFWSWVWCCSLRVTLPLWFRLDLCLAGNVLSQPGMTTASGRLDPPPRYLLKHHSETACWLSFDGTGQTSVFPFIVYIIIFGFGWSCLFQTQTKSGSGQDFMCFNARLQQILHYIIGCRNRQITKKSNALD